MLARQLIADALREHKVSEITMVEDGQKAKEAIYIAHASKTPYHVVFLDWDMPEVSGFDVLKHFREQPKFSDMAFVMFTATAEHTSVLQAVKAGATTYIIKPVTQEGISKKFVEIAHWVKQKSASHGK
jgi:two-component system, chemotaxis family, chemotaxis protein CheY